MTQFLEELLDIVNRIKDLASPDHPIVDSTEHLDSPSNQIDLPVFFGAVRQLLFQGRLTAGQVQGMESKLSAFLAEGFPVSWAAYALATSYHETARRMLPVREGLSASESWRKAHLRYYPYYGRGDVQLTWRENYERVDRELQLKGALINNLDLALDKDISAKVLVKGMKNGWFSKGQTLGKHLPDRIGTRDQFKSARRIVNIQDKALLIADIALKFQEALLEAKYP